MNFQLYLFLVGNECRQRRGSVGSLDSGMSISFQSTSTNNNNNNASNCKAAESQAYNQQPTSSNQQQRQVQHANNVIIPPLLPNSALYQYNNDQMMHMHELYEDHHRIQHAEATGRSTDV